MIKSTGSEAKGSMFTSSCTTYYVPKAMTYNLLQFLHTRINVNYDFPSVVGNNCFFKPLYSSIFFKLSIKQKAFVFHLFSSLSIY